MDEETLKSIAGQLRQPHGENAIQVGEKMNTGNFYINMYTNEALKPTSGDNILEIGMGNGFFVKNIVSGEDNIRYAGCDFSEAMVNEAHKYNKKLIASGHAKFHLASADNLPFDNETFNKIFTINTIYFWDNPALVLSDISRVLKSKGQIIIAVRPKSVMQYYPFVKYGFKMYSKEDLTGLLTANNFKVSSIIEKDEPEQEINGHKVIVKALLVCAEKQ